jgi:hypothetical protein
MFLARAPSGANSLLDNDRAFLWTVGYVPRLNTYLGPETPNLPPEDQE